MSRCLHWIFGGFLFVLASITMSAQVAPELYWGLNINPQRGFGYINMVWFNVDGDPRDGGAPINAFPAIPMFPGEWTSEAGPWWLDAVQVQGHPAILLVLTTGYGGELRGFRATGGNLQACGKYSLSLLNGENGGVRVAPSGSFAVVAVGTNPEGVGDDLLLNFPLRLTTATNLNDRACILAGPPARFPVPNNTAIRNVDFNPDTNKQEVVITGYSNVVTFMNPTTGDVICDVELDSSLTHLQARYNPAGTEVWASAYSGRQIAVIQPPSGNPISCPVMQYIDGFGLLDGLAGGSFHPNSSIHVYYVESYPQGNVYAIDTMTKTVSRSIHIDGAIGMTAVTRGTNGTYYLEMPLSERGVSRTDTYDVTTFSQAHDFSTYLGSHASGMDWQRIATLRTVLK